MRCNPLAADRTAPGARHLGTAPCLSDAHHPQVTHLLGRSHHTYAPKPAGTSACLADLTATAARQTHTYLPARPTRRKWPPHCSSTATPAAGLAQLPCSVCRARWLTAALHAGSPLA